MGTIASRCRRPSDRQAESGHRRGRRGRDDLSAKRGVFFHIAAGHRHGKNSLCLSPMREASACHLVTGVANEGG